MTYPPVILRMIGLCLSNTTASKSRWLFYQELDKESYQCRQQEGQNKPSLKNGLTRLVQTPNRPFLSISSTFSHGRYFAYLNPYYKIHAKPKCQFKMQNNKIKLHSCTQGFRVLSYILSLITSGKSLIKFKKKPEVEKPQ